MKIALTGAAGFIGSCFLSHLNRRGFEDIVVIDLESRLDDSKNLQNKKYSQFCSREEFLSQIRQGKHADIDGIVHLGACADTTEMNRDYLRVNNVEYSQILATWCFERNKFFHYASSASVYGDGKLGYSDDDSLIDQFKPLNPYAESKWLFDQWIIKNKFVDRVVGYRYFNVFGPNEQDKGNMRSMVCKAFEQIQATGKARLFANSRPGYFDGSEQRDFIYVKDVCRIMDFFLLNQHCRGIFNLGTGKSRTFKDLVSAVFMALNRPVQIEYFPMPEVLKRQYQYFTEAEIGKLRSVGYQGDFTELEEAVKDYVITHLVSGTPY